MATVLSNEIKRIIDDARDTLVGQIPVPMMQCQQITLALTYKFMSDDDQQAVDLGGRRHYFTSDLEQYEWSKVVSLRLDDTQRSKLYRDGLAALQESESLPAVFREIFKDAIVPYGDHRTLALFLNTMNRMEYDDTEKLGDAYEYLLKIAEAQADAGQFRTPRHIIDFIVKIIDPQKHEVIIDPACGTAGFLVSAYQHVLSQHRLPGGRTSLSTPDRTRLANNLRGYDISPEMTKLAMANMYLHTQDKNPNIDNYDTLTSADHWNDYADVMLANPPFMTPKGGIRPHDRFRVSAKKAEVLFVDYIASHLNEHGRAGIIVPEGIIFQSQNNYKQLRRLLVDESLVAVISLPNGVFQPYSGVKTSILILDKVLAPKADSIAFFKVENDGYDLGAQRRPIGQDDLPAIADEVNEYLRRLRVGESLDDSTPQMGLLATKERVAEDGEYNLSGERYRQSFTEPMAYPRTTLGTVAKFLMDGDWIESKDQSDSGIRLIQTGNIGLAEYIDKPQNARFISEETFERLKCTEVLPGDVLISRLPDPVGRACIAPNPTSGMRLITAVDCTIIRFDEQYLLPELFVALTKSDQYYRGVTGYLTGSTRSRISRTNLAKVQIPLPPLEVQREFVAEIEGYQRVIDGARAVVNNWRPRIVVDPEWPEAGIADLVAAIPHSLKAGPFGSSLKKDCYVPAGYKIYGQEQVIRGDVNFGDYYIDEEKFRELESCKVRAGDVLVSLVGTYGKTLIVPDEHEPGIINPRLVKITLDQQKMIPEFLGHLFTQDYIISQMQAVSHGGTMNILGMQTLKRLRFPLPPLDAQRIIVAELDEEKVAVDQAERLAFKMEQRIQDTIARVWQG